MEAEASSKSESSGVKVEVDQSVEATNESYESTDNTSLVDLSMTTP
jgi:hypothetical protein